jgi:hypothetical protein
MKLAFLIFSVVLVGCGPYKPQPVEPDDVTIDKPCEAAEATLLELQCKDSKGKLLGGPTLRDVSFQQFCLDAIEEGSMDTSEAVCLAKLKSCDGVELCGEE